ncbi:uncharacterized protein LOC119071962 [Bradysia coprophila]|uniref:uncharacterized protein LOC119071962 n=1 Tax=Bradysia coprophila TaxID=38358 RepID=UPI00187D8EFE|nr:uncharacterized protein LOC119071962 [Bradysia coprophila]
MQQKLESVSTIFAFALICHLNAPLQSSVDAWRPFEVLHSNVSAVSYSDRIFINASIDDQMRLNVYFLSSTEIYPFVNARVMVDSGNGLYDLEYFNRTVNVCRLLSDPKYEPFLQLVARTTLPASNFPKRCPIGKKLFYVKNLKPNPEEFPPVLPDKKFYFSIRLLSKDASTLKPLIAYKIYIEIKNK